MDVEDCLDGWWEVGDAMLMHCAIVHPEMEMVDRAFCNAYQESAVLFEIASYSSDVVCAAIKWLESINNHLWLHCGVSSRKDGESA